MNTLLIILEIHFVFTILASIVHSYILGLLYEKIVKVAKEKGIENPHEIAELYTRVTWHDLVDFITPILNILFVIIATINLIKKKDEYISELIIEMFK